MSSIESVVSSIKSLISRGNDDFQPLTIISRLHDIHQQQLADHGTKSRRFQPKQDTPLRSLYRMYSFLVLDWKSHLQREIAYFWTHEGWGVSDIPDPEDTDLVRAAILAALPHILVTFFNETIAKGLPRYSPPIIIDIEEVERQRKRVEASPAWSDVTMPLKDKLVLPLRNSNETDLIRKRAGLRFDVGLEDITDRLLSRCEISRKLEGSSPS